MKKAKHFCLQQRGRRAAATAAEGCGASRLRLLPALLLATFAVVPAVAQDGSFQLGTVVVTGTAQGLSLIHI